ncbi:MAG: TolC family protein [Planctomycetota bacterium]
MNRSLFQFAAQVQLALAVLLATGCTPTQPFFVGETPNLHHYLDHATEIEYPDVESHSLPETTQSLPPLTVSNHDYEFWDLTLEQCVHMALENARYLITTGGTAETRQNIAAQFVSGSPAQFGSIFDVALQQTTTQSIPLTTDGAGNRLLPRGAVRANQIGGVEDALAEFDAVASGFLDFSNTDRPQNVSVLNDDQQFLRNYNNNQQFAISKRLSTGGVATIRQQVQYTRNESGNIVPRAAISDYTTIIEAQVQHPLMRNRGTYINRIPVMLASMNEDISIATFEGQVRNLVRDVEVAYWDLYLAYRAVSAAAIARDSAQATAEFTKLNFAAGTGSIQEKAQAVGQYFNLQRRLTAALSGSNVPGSDPFGVYGRERILREKLGLSATDGRLIRPSTEPTIARVEYDWNESVAQMLYLSPEVRARKYELKQAELELALAKNQVLPEVNLSLLYRWVGLGDTFGPPDRTLARFPEAGSSSLAELTSGDYQEAAVRLDFSMPIGLRREMLRVRNAQMTQRQRLFFLQDQERLLVSQLADAVGKMGSHFEQLQIAANEWMTTEQEVDARLFEYRKGTTPVNVVLQSQQRRADAQLAYYQALTEYNKSINYVDFLKGTLLSNSSIRLEEGPWNTKAYCDALERARERSAGFHHQYGVTRPGVVRRGPVDVNKMMSDAFGLPETQPGMVPQVGEAPLQEMEEPADLFMPDAEMEDLQRILPEPDPNFMGQEPTMVPPANAVPADRMPMDQLRGPSNAPVESSILDSTPIGSAVAPMSYQAESARAENQGPLPVRRKRVPHRVTSPPPPATATPQTAGPGW